MVSYSLIDSTKIKVLRQEGEKGDTDFPYSNYPIHYNRRPISLVPIDYSLAKLLAIYQEIDELWLSEEDRKSIEVGLRTLRHRGFGKNDVNRHQLGGLPRLVQNHIMIGCPNSSCKAHKYFFHDKSLNYFMKELAVIFNDPFSGLPMVDPISETENLQEWDPYVQVVFYVCEECLSITAMNQFA